MKTASLLLAACNAWTLTCAAIVVGHAAPVEPGVPAEVSTDSATPLGLDGMTVNGRIQPHGLPTRYWFEFGADPSGVQRTAVLPLPPQLAAYFHEDWQSGAASGWGGGMSQRDLQAIVDPQTGEGFVRIVEPTKDDPNHVDGIGTLHLSKFIYSGLVVPRRGGSAYLGGGEPDFRDAEVSLQLRGQNFQANGAELLWWTQRMIDASVQFTDAWECTNWAYTGFRLTDKLASGQWERVTYRLENNSRKWTYSGNNPAQERAERYVYAPLDPTLGNINADFFHLLAFVDPSNSPTGAIDFADISLRYRNHSLLRAGNGGRLANAPTDPVSTAKFLTDGWRHGADRMWTSVSRPTASQEFVYELAAGACVHTVMVHQNPEHPAREIEVLASQDGETWTLLLNAALEKSSPMGPNFNFVRRKFPSLAARWIKFRVLSGYQTEAWGVGEIEVFGSGVPMATDDDWYNVNLDINGLQAGTTYYYRLVAENSAGLCKGPQQSFTTPSSRQPLVSTQPAERTSKNSTELWGLVTTLGLKTEYYFEYGNSRAYGIRTPSFYGGTLTTPRPVKAALTGLQPDSEYHFRLVAVNAEGISFGDDGIFRTKPAQ